MDPNNTPESPKDLLDYLQNNKFRLQHVDPFVKTYHKTCRDRVTIEEAKELVPIAELVQNNLEILEDTATYKDKLLPLVVDWFANDFFKWFEAPQCEKCCDHLVFSNSFMNQEQKQVERYVCECNRCSYHFDFIRHNQPAILLRTRTGRCGEWANCFLTILLALDYDARVVVDSTDHVWNEVWSETRDQWIHVDPCERVVDQPLLYEVGWSKRLIYCLAFGRYDVLDVTPRYCVDFNATKTRRTQCEESWLKNYLDEVTEERLKLVPTDARELVRQRRAKDVEYLQKILQKPQDIPDKSQLAGRKTGDLRWRVARGECSSLVKSDIVIKVRPKADQDKLASIQPLFELLYNCDRNTYESTTKEYHHKRGWSTLTYEYENIDFKYERDWKTSYVARYDSCPHDHVGKVVWRFDLSEMLNLRDLDRLEILLRGLEYPNTSLKLSLKCYATPDISSLSETLNLKLNELNSLKVGERIKPETRYLDLTATLSGGDENDSVAWQKPQLFRQVRNKDAHEWKFSFKVFSK